MKINYQLMTDKIIAALPEGERPKLLLHSCCGPCSSYVLEYLTKHFDILLHYYNPNIFPESEFEKRLAEQEKLLRSMPMQGKVILITQKYDHDEFLEAAAGLENEPEGGARCSECFRLRMEAAAKKALELGCDFFATTLSVSPHKNAGILNEIGEELENKYGVRHLPADFKKREGYKRSIELAAEYDLYRQDYCGCEFAMRSE